ncbi:MAG: ABC transporter permease, partial [Alphaproteobacteria bacterium]|nr:ABC transporter permease [Alphaproteobacteria bacterium]
MLRYTARRLLLMSITVIGMVTVVFFLLRAIPGDPASYMLGDYATEESVAALKAELGLDRPVWEQYLGFVKRALTGDLGTSVVTGQPAFDEVLESIPWSAALSVSGIIIAVLAGVPLGVMSAVRHGTFADLFVMLGALIGISFPVFWVGLVCILLLAHEVRLFPALGASSSQDFFTQVHHLMLPALVLGFSVAAYIAR